MVPVEDNTTAPTYKELPVRNKSLKGLDVDPRLSPLDKGMRGPPRLVCPFTVRELFNIVSPNTVAVVPTIKFLAMAAPPAICRASV